MYDGNDNFYTSDISYAMEAIDKSINDLQETINLSAGSSLQITNEVVSARGESTSLKGRLDSIENSIGTSESNIEHVSLKVESIIGTSYINPDNYSGSDVEKIQSAYDEAILSGGSRVITLGREYDLTGGVIYVPSENWTPTVTFEGGSIVKNDAGFMFDRNSENMSIDAPMFLNVKFYGSSTGITTVLNCSKMVRPSFQNCYFKNIQMARSETFIQSIRFVNNEMYYSPAPFIKAQRVYDAVITNNRCEASNNPFLEVIENIEGNINIVGGTINSNLFEGYTLSPVFRIGSAYSLTINFNYFEFNNTHIEFVNNGGVTNISGEIRGNLFYRNSGDFDIKFNGNVRGNLLIEANTTDISGTNKAFLNEYSDNYRSNFLVRNGKRFPTGSAFRHETQNLLETSASQHATKGLDIYIKRLSNHPAHTVGTVNGKNFIVEVSSKHGSSALYRGSYLGILTIHGVYDTTEAIVKIRASLKNLVKWGTSGSTTGAEGADSDITVEFNSTGKNDTLSTDADNGVHIYFSKLTYDSSTTVVNIKPVESLRLFGEDVIK